MTTQSRADRKVDSIIVLRLKGECMQVQALPLRVSCPAERSVLLPPPGAHISYRPGPPCWKRSAPGWSNSGGFSVSRTTPAERKAPEERRRSTQLSASMWTRALSSSEKVYEQHTWYLASSLLFHNVWGTSWMESRRLWVLSLKLRDFGSSNNFPPICFSICKTSWTHKHTHV